MDEKPGLAAYSRASDSRELNGDQAGAVTAMRLAVAAGGGVPRTGRTSRALLGDLELQRGHAGLGARCFPRRLQVHAPGTRPHWWTRTGGRAAQGQLPAAPVTLLRRATSRLPLTTSLTLLADVELASGMRHRPPAPDLGRRARRAPALPHRGDRARCGGGAL